MKIPAKHCPDSVLEDYSQNVWQFELTAQTSLAPAFSNSTTGS